MHGHEPADLDTRYKPKALSVGMTLGQTTLTRLIQHLTDLGYVEKSRITRRKGSLELSPSGRSVLQHAFSLWQTIDEEINARLTPESTAHVREVMTMVSNAAVEIERVPPRLLDVTA